jgi:hypothetical protein
MTALADLDHFEVFLADSALGADEVIRHVTPGGARRDAFVGVSLGLVVDPATHDALPFPHV